MIRYESSRQAKRKKSSDSQIANFGLLVPGFVRQNLDQNRRSGLSPKNMLDKK